jgi:hypothetical protein
MVNRFISNSANVESACQLAKPRIVKHFQTLLMSALIAGIRYSFGSSTKYKMIFAENYTLSWGEGNGGASTQSNL